MTLREFILAQSTLPTGNLVRDHLNNPAELGDGEFIVLSDGLELEMDNACMDIEVDLSTVDIEIENNEVEVEIESAEYDIEVC